MTNHKQHSVTVQQVWQVLNEFAPPELAAEWDTAIGLEIGHPDQIVSKILLTLDVSADALQKALHLGCELIISHHPLLFSPVPTVRDDIPEQKLLADLIRSQISLLAAHTNLDAANGGVADCLADQLDLPKLHRQPVSPYGRYNKLSEPVLGSLLLAKSQDLLGSVGCRINTVQDRLITTLAVFPGSFNEAAVPFLQEMGIEAVVCGEIKHHVGLMLNARGIIAIDVGHDVSERVVLKPLADRLSQRLPQIKFAVYEGFDYNRVAFRASQTTAGAG